MIDIGVNLLNARFDHDRAEVIARAKSAALSHLILTGTSVANSTAALAICQQYPDYLSCTAGIHPHDADAANVGYLEQLKHLASYKAVKAIGECGLDFNRNFSTPENQTRVFAEQIALAAELNMPLFLHQRDAFTHWLALLLPYIDKVPAMVAHCFTGNKTELLQCLDNGMYIGITGWLCDKKRGEELRDIVKYIPLERLMIETDAPYLTPQNIKPKPKSSRNEPAYLPFVVEALAAYTQYSVADIIVYSQHNTKKVFAIEN